MGNGIEEAHLALLVLALMRNWFLEISSITDGQDNYPVLQRSRGDSQFHPEGKESLTFSFSPAESCWSTLKVSTLIHTEQKSIFLLWWEKKTRLASHLSAVMKWRVRWIGEVMDWMADKTATTLTSNLWTARHTRTRTRNAITCVGDPPTRLTFYATGRQTDSEFTQRDAEYGVGWTWNSVSEWWKPSHWAAWR